MKTRVKIFLSAGLLVSALGWAAGAEAQSMQAPSGDIGLSYRWTRSNTQPGVCGCFSLNGGGVSGSWDVGSKWAVSASVDGQYAGHGPSTADSLTLVSYLGGVRYRLPEFRPRGPLSLQLQPYVHLLVGAEHAGGGLAGAGDGETAFAARMGGGIDLPVGHAFALRVLEADYGLSTFENGSSNYQNTLQLSAGLVFRWHAHGQH